MASTRLSPAGRAASAFGAAVALAEAGAAVTVIARRGEEISATVAALTGADHRANGHAVDVTDFAAVRDLVASAPEPFDILVNSAGGARHANFLNITEADYRTIIELNLGATLFVSQAVAARLVAAGKPGSIIHISSQMGHVGGPDRSVYSASKLLLRG